MITTILIFIFILGLMVFVHELGHFISARKLGVGVDEFGFGFPPRILGIRRKAQGRGFEIIKGRGKKNIDQEENNNTIYSINWIPLGGFVKIKGESGEFSNDKDSFVNKKPWQKAIILSAGVLMNILLAMAVLSVGYMIGLPQELDYDDKHAIIKDEKIQITQVVSLSPAEAAGIKPGDEIISIDGNYFTDTEEIMFYIKERPGQNMQFKLQEINAEKIIVVKSEKYSTFIPNTPPDFENEYAIGINFSKIGKVSYPWYMAIIKGIVNSILLLKLIIIALYHIIKELIMSQQVSIPVAGPVGIIVITKQAATMGFVYLMNLTAILSLNLAIINFLPFPALDGGRVLFLIIEKIRRKAINPNTEAIIHNIGFFLLIFLLILVTYKDVTSNSQLFVNLWEKIKGII